MPLPYGKTRNTPARPIAAIPATNGRPESDGTERNVTPAFANRGCCIEP
jgi:hypothetical protein